MPKQTQMVVAWRPVTALAAVAMAGMLAGCTVHQSPGERPSPVTAEGEQKVSVGTEPKATDQPKVTDQAKAAEQPKATDEPARRWRPVVLNPAASARPEVAGKDSGDVTGIDAERAVFAALGVKQPEPNVSWSFEWAPMEPEPKLAVSFHPNLAAQGPSAALGTLEVDRVHHLPRTAWARMLMSSGRSHVESGRNLVVSGSLRRGDRTVRVVVVTEERFPVPGAVFQRLGVVTVMQVVETAEVGRERAAVLAAGIEESARGYWLSQGYDEAQMPARIEGDRGPIQPPVKAPGNEFEVKRIGTQWRIGAQ